MQQGGQRVLKVEADDSYGNLVHATQAPLNASTTLAWRWRVDTFVQDADLRTRAGDDGAAKVCVFFDFPADRLSFGERTRLALARRTTGEDVPSEALCYVWDNKEAKGTALVNAFTKRMRMVVLESGPAATPGTWLSEKRNLLADYRRVFGDEAGDTLPDVVAVAISADADNTHGRGLAYFSDLDLRSIATTRSAAAPARSRTSRRWANRRPRCSISSLSSPPRAPPWCSSPRWRRASARRCRRHRFSWWPAACRSAAKSPSPRCCWPPCSATSSATAPGSWPGAAGATA